MLIAAGTGLLAGVARVAFDAFVQAQWAPSERGPGYARYEAVLQGGWLVGAALGAMVPLGPRLAAVLLGLLAGAGALGAWRAGRRLGPTGRRPDGSAPGGDRGSDGDREDLAETPGG